MAWRTKQCSAPSCSAIAEQGKQYCITHKDYISEYKKVLRDKCEWSGFYGLAVWQKLRRLVRARDPICCLCNRAPATECDHIIAHKGNWFLFCGGINMENLQGLCSSCHSRKTALEDSNWIKSKGETQCRS
jgi:5-methylcytosine-specific restriction protein A